MYMCLNGEILECQSPCISPLNEGFLYGYGLFETIKVSNREPYFLKEHIRRIKAGCSVLSFDFIYNEDILYEYCLKLIKKNKLDSGAIRLTYSKNANSYILLISSRENNYTEGDYERGFKLCFADIKRNPHSPIVYLKSNNYLDNLLARKKAKEKNFDEAVFINVYGKVCEGTISNIFFVRNSKIFTPDIDCGILSGILRDKVIDAINDLDLELSIGHYERNQLYDSDEIFITNSLIDIMPVRRLDDKRYDIQNNSVTKILMKEIKKLYNE